MSSWIWSQSTRAVVYSIRVPVHGPMCWGWGVPTKPLSFRLFQNTHLLFSDDLTLYLLNNHFYNHLYKVLLDLCVNFLFVITSDAHNC